MDERRIPCVRLKNDILVLRNVKYFRLAEPDRGPSAKFNTWGIVVGHVDGQWWRYEYPDQRSAHKDFDTLATKLGVS